MPAREAGRFARLAARVREEQGSVTAVVSEGTAALARHAGGDPDGLTLRGIAGVLHDFYTGIERILEAAALELEGSLPGGPRYHTEVLQGAARELPEIRPAILSYESSRALSEYLMAQAD